MKGGAVAGGVADVTFVLVWHAGASATSSGSEYHSYKSRGEYINTEQPYYILILIILSHILPAVVTFCNTFKKKKTIHFGVLQLTERQTVLGTYGLTLLGSWKPCASACGLSGGGWGRRAGSVGWGAFCNGDWITPFRLPSTPFILPARDAISPPTIGREELPAWLMDPSPSPRPRLRPFSSGWLKEAGLCWGGGVLWKERDELLRDGLPEWSSWNKDGKSPCQL